MQLFENLEDWMTFRKTISNEQTLGFAPTMGNLHAGHVSLFVESQKENEFTVSSLFINPTQFNNQTDYQFYPRTLEQDLEIMKNAGVNFCILPDEKSMYPDGYRYQIQEQKLSRLMEGVHRPGHFQGMLTVVMKLLQLTRPTTAYFGEKDYQQFLLIKAMAEAFFLNTEIKACPTVREPSGLAYSSRNNRLDKEQKLRAEAFAKVFHNNDSCVAIVEALQAKNIAVDYIEEYQNRRFAAVRIDEVRLIDNYAIE